MKYVVFFEFFGRKMKHAVEAESEQEAKKIISNKIIFYKVEHPKPNPHSDEDFLNYLKDIFGTR